uniref:Alkyl transferase n=1 Tax=Rhabditophanes sp. KR3021 TaxID=114890 RepID=A0AC35UHF6_9BILA
MESTRKHSWFPEDNCPWWLVSMRYIMQKIGPIPNHVAFVMDGNRRFAKSKNLGSAVEGHKMGFQQLAKIIDWCREFDIKEVTVYAFSIENFKRSKEEVDGLLELAEKQFQELLDEKNELEKRKVCFRFFGDMQLLSPNLQSLTAKIELTTKNYSHAFINICLAYSSQNEIERAMKKMEAGVTAGVLKQENVTEDLLEKCLDTRYGSPIDLFIRTSGEQRFSDFLLYQCSNTHLYFDDVLWPDFGAWHLIKAVRSFQGDYDKVKQISHDLQASREKSSEFNKHDSVQEQRKFLDWVEIYQTQHLIKMAQQHPANLC